MCVVHRQGISASKIRPPFSFKKKSEPQDWSDVLMLQQKEARPATDALLRTLPLVKQQQWQRLELASGTTSSGIKSSGKVPMLVELFDLRHRGDSGSSSDEDKTDARRYMKSIQYLEHLSIHKADPSLRGLVRSMSIRENLCDLVMRDNDSRLEINCTFNSVADALPSVDVEPLVHETDSKTKKVGEDIVSLEAIANKNQSSQVHPLLHEQPALLS